MQVPLIPMEMREDESAEEVTYKDEFLMLMENPYMRPIVRGFGILAILAALGGVVFWLRRRSGHLLKSTPDVRLSALYGSGVSRNVHYLEGREAKKAQRII